MRRRMFVALMGITTLFMLLSIRLVYLMLIKGPEYKAMAQEQWTSRVLIDAKRGRILDTNYNELAVSGNVYRVDLDLNAIKKYITDYNKKHKEQISNEDLALKIGEALEMDKFEVLKKLESKLPSGAPMQSAILARRIEKVQADKLKALKINGVLISPDTKRFYPNNNFLAHVLGVTDSDGKGLTGIEYKYEEELKGSPGVRLAEIDRNSGELPYTISEYTKPIEGKDVVLTIDEKIQFFAEKAANQALIDNKALAVTIVVMNPKNGEVLALVNKPDYDPNKPREGAANYDELQKKWRNRAVSDTFEPGSIFKVITAAAAMQEGKVGEHDTFTCGGSTTIANRTIKCWKSGGHGTQNFSDIIKNSCNIGFIQLGQKLGKENLHKYIKLFGFGEKSGVDLPGEANGIIMPLEKMTEVDLATISFGQANTVGTMQFMAAFNTIANNGVWIRPHLMKEIVHTDEDGTRISDKKFENLGKKKIIDEGNTKTLRSYLERVVTEGSAKKAMIEGYHIGGKTGTAQKVINGVYAPSKYISSFVGMAPIDDPQITLMVTIDEPGNGEYYAGQVAAPVAQRVFNDIFNYLSLKSDSSPEGTANSLLRDVVIPDVRGMKKEEAFKILRKDGLNYNLEGEGETIVDISPKPGYSVKEGSKINLYLGNNSNYNKDVVVPDLKGYSRQGAIDLLNKINLKAVISGEGMVTEQSIHPNEFVKKGTTVELILDHEVGD
ncbi:stage V sporulation protein D [Clostridium polynesiense]|uniref:stage V sporulation protein D n=1 Tax=Clostridium polynesiense TaxID=1325933 RepID=UPI00058BF729|nr:stage V sporulation protein D [Clostridium polynesiense]